MLFEGHAEALKLKPSKKRAASKKKEKNITRVAAEGASVNSKEKTVTTKGAKKPKSDLTTSSTKPTGAKSKISTNSSDETSE